MALRQIPAKPSLHAAIGLLLVAPLGVAACRDGNEPTQSAALELSATTVGADLDPDGYAVSVDGRTSQALATAGTVLRIQVEPGSHSVSLTGIAANCTLAGENPRTITVSASDTLAVPFELECVALAGGLALLNHPPPHALSGVPLSSQPMVQVLDAHGRPNPDARGVVTATLGSGSGTLNGTTSVFLDGVGRAMFTDLGITGPPGPRTLRFVATDYDVATDYGSIISEPVSVIPDPAAGTLACIQLGPDSVHTDVYLIRADGSGETRLTTTPGDDHAVQFSPDGTRLAFVSDGPPAGLFLVNVDGSGQRLLTEHGGDTLAWSPDGRMIASDPGDVWVIDAAGGTPKVLVENGKNPVWFPDGGQIGFERSEVIGGFTSGALFRIGAHGSGLTKLTDIPEGIEGKLAWSPNRETIAFVQVLSTGGVPDRELFTMATDGSNLVQLTHSDQDRERNPPVWSPDGQKIAAMRLTAHFAVDRIIVVNADGTGEVTLNTGPSFPPNFRAHNSFDPAWSPQGNKIAFQRQLAGFPGAPPGPEETWVVNADGTNPIKISDCDGTLDWQP